MEIHETRKNTPRLSFLKTSLGKIAALLQPTVFQQIFWRVFGGLLLSVGLLFAVLVFYVQKSEGDYWRTYTSVSSQNGAEAINAALGEINDDLRRLSSIVIMERNNPARLQAILNDHAVNSNLIQEIMLSDQTGTVLYDIMGDSLPPVGAQVWPELKNRLAGSKEALTLDVSDPVNKEKTISVTIPFEDGKGGMLYLTSLSYISHLDAFKMFTDYRLGNSVHGYIVDGRGLIVAHPDKNRIGDNVDQNPVVQKVLAGEVGFQEVTNTRGAEMLASYIPLRQLGWGLVVQVPVEQVSGRSGTFQLVVAFVFLLVALISSVNTWRISRRIAKPVEELAAATKGMLRGDYKPVSQLSGPIEVRQLMEAFNDMGRRLQEQRDVWEEAQYRKRLLIGIGRIIISSRNRVEMFQQVFNLLHINIKLGYGICWLFAEGDERSSRRYSFHIKEKDYSFDETLEGRAKFKELLGHLTAGDSIPVQGEFLPGYRIPDDIPAVLAPIYDSKKLLGICILGGIEEREGWSEDKGFFHLFSMLLNYGHQLMNLLENLHSSMNELADRERKLQESVVKLEEANRIKGNFLSIVSHELRTPLNVINGYSELLLAQETADPAETRFMLEKIIDSEQSLTRLIEDILFFSQIGSGSFSLNQGEVPLGRVVKEEIRGLQEAASRKQLEIILDWEEGLPPVRGDLKQVCRVVGHLLDNAIKFTEKGFIRVQGQLLIKERMVRLAVQDSGIGIEPTSRNVIFQSFSQVDAAHTRRFGGAGLGLAIAKELVEAMAGRIGFISDGLGCGSTFYVDLPIWDAKEAIRMMIEEFSEEEKEKTGLLRILPKKSIVSQSRTDGI